MDLLDLFVKIGVKDEASEGIAQVSDGAIGKLVGAAKGAAKALAGMWAVKKVVDFGKAAFDAYSSFEQLEGGVAKLYGNANQSLDDYLKSMKDSGKSVDELTQTYQRNEQAQELMMQQATEAWRTAGVDANTYMEQATSMSAALISSLGGDTVKAAEQTDVAMRAISDNVNTFGTDMESVSQAFMGFSKQNYTMLDNLKLGYGGTKTEMERLIKDANEWGAANGKASDLSIDSFSDVVTAIEQIQEKQGVAGTTTREAMTTIEGSMNATKAAWQNLVTEFGKPDANVSARVGDLFDAVFGVVDEKSQEREGGLFKNVTSEVGVIAQNMIRAAGDGLSAAIDWIASNAPRLVTNAMKSIGDAIGNAASGLGSFTENFNLVDAIFGEGGAGETASKALEWIQGLGQTFSDNWPYIQEQLGNLWNQVVETAQTYGPQIMEVAGRLLTMAGDAIREHAPELLAKAGELIGKLLAHIGTFTVQMVSKGRELIMGIVTGTSDEGKNLRKWFSDFFPDGLLRGLGDFATFLLDAGRSLINGLLDGIGEVAPDVEQAIRDAFDKVLAFFGGVADFIKDPVGSIKSGLESLGGSFDSTADGIEKDTGRAEGSIKRLDRAKLSDKKAKATVTGNAVDGKGKSAIEKTDASVKKLKDKSVSVTVHQKGLTATMIGSLKQQIDRLRDKNVTVTTTQKTVTKKEKTGGAWGGITPRYHATGGVRVADRYGEGEPLDIVGERGPEAIVPLTSHYGKDFAQMMGREAAKEMGGGRPVVNIYMTYNAGEDATQLVSDLAAGLELVL
jgi:phage-related protein